MGDLWRLVPHNLISLSDIIIKLDTFVHSLAMFYSNSVLNVDFNMCAPSCS